jgi:two-component system response regulator YesN
MEGYYLIKEKQPDIVITDIRMPQADGLEMIRLLKEEECSTKFIILSGFAEFEYARKGIQLGVQFYLNKPVEEEELRDCVRKVMGKIHAEREALLEMDSLKEEVQSQTQERNLRELLDAGNDNLIPVEDLLRISNIPLDHTQCICAVLECHPARGAFGDSGIELILKKADAVFSHYRKVYRFRFVGSQLAIVITHKEGQIAYHEIVQAFRRLKREVYADTRLVMTIGIGTIKNSPIELRASFEEARLALSYKIIKGTDAVIPYPDILKLSGKRHIVPEETITKLESCLDNLDEDGCIRLIQDLFQRVIADQDKNLSDLQTLCLNILLSSVRKMSLEQLQQNDVLGKHILSLEGISRFQTLDSLEEWMVQVIRGIISFKKEHSISIKKDVILEIKEFVAQHYHESISLADLSSRFYINSYYLSQLFKQKTGDTYLNYLAKIRINKSKELLEQTNFKVYEICQMVGYSDPQHFTRLFEKLTGVKPSEYRKSFSRS